MKKLSHLALLFCGLVWCLILFPHAVKAAGTLTPTAQNNLSVTLKRTSDFVPTSDGYMRVFCKSSSVAIEYYDNDLQIKSRKEVAMELPIWGGFYAGSDGYYLVEGQNNTAEDNSAEVIRVIRYDTNWKRNGAASITSNPQLFGGEVRYPFNVGCVEMTESNGKLYIVTGHQGYVDPDINQGHQGFLMIEVDQSTMKGKIVECDLWHSFAQYIKSHNSYLYVLEQSEGSRCTKLTRYDTATFDSTTINLLSYGGSRTSTWAVACYASVDGMALSSDNVLCIGTSIDQSKYDEVNENTSHNIYLTVTPMSDFSKEATKVIQLTNYTGDGKSFLGVKITKITDNRFMVSWEEYTTETGKYTGDDNLSSSTLHYLFIDGKGNVIGKNFTASAPISNCQPVVKDSKVVYYASDANTLNFYTIDSQNGSVSKKPYHIAGENATWNFSNGVLTISGQGVLSISTDTDYRTPISSTQYWFTYSSGSVWSSIKDQVKKIVIKSGITSISEGAFKYLPNLQEVEIENGLKTIEKEAFAENEALEKITIPASVTNIGEDIVWTGSYWTYNNAHVTYATIYAPHDSYAIQYAKKNSISYCIDLSGASVTGLNQTYTYAGSPVTPVPTVSLGNTKLKINTDFKVTYTNNQKSGTATLKIEGIGNYQGAVTRTFQITEPPKTATPTPVPSSNNTPKTIRDSKYVYAVNKSGKTVTLKKPRSKNITTLNVPSYVKYKGTKYKVVSIYNGAFKNCRNLKTATIAGNITTIGSGAFQGCTSLRTLKIGSKVTVIKDKAFYGCQSLTSVTISTTRLSSKNLGKNVFTKAGKNNYAKLKIKVPKSRYSKYRKLLKNIGLSAKATVTR